MRIIIAGAGEVGTHLAKMLSKENHDIVVIDSDEEKLRVIDSHFDILTIHGSATSISTLKDARIKKTDLFISVTTNEEVNIIAAILGKRLGAKKTIARIDSYEYLIPANKTHFIELGIDSLIYPQKLASREIVSLLNQTGTTEIFDFADGRLSLFVIKLEKNAPIINKTLMEAAQMDEERAYRAVAITRDNQTIIPRGQDIFKEHDIVYVITDKSGIKNIVKFSGQHSLDINNIMIIGASRIGLRTAKDLEKNITIKLIEINKNKCYEIADFLTNTMIINGDGRDSELLEEEGIKKMDAFIAATGNSETNIFSCLIAKKFGVKKTIAEVENIDYIDTAESMGIDAIINKKLIAASHIFRFTMDAEVSSLVCLIGSNAEVLEFVAHSDSKITKGTLKEIKFPKDAIVGGVVRGKSAFIAIGDTRVKPNDKVVVFALPSAIHKIGDYFN
ncbi:MAG: Trk system potassium transporter TrkA [Bacteroidales bacterium]|nr:Trk system potassium transporter TrkA [Bacteroidales bacterium]